MSKKLFSKIFVLLLVVGLLFAAAPKQAQAQTVSTWDGTYPGTKPAEMLDPVDGVQEVHTAAEFAWLANQTTMFEPGVTTVKLMVDIDLAEYPWTPSTALSVGGKVLDGNQHTISNLKVLVDNATVGTYYFAAMFVGTYQDVLIKDLTIDGAVIGATNTTINNRVYSAVLHSHTDWYGDLENVTVKNATVYGTKYVAALVGYAGVTDIKNCTVQNVTLTVNEKLRSGSTSRDEPHIGALIGLHNDGDVSGNTVSGLTINLTPIYEPIFLGQTGGLIGTAQDLVLVGANSVSDVTLNGTPYSTLIGLDKRTLKVVNATQMLGYTTIQAAIDNAADSDVIEVAPGTYDENGPLTLDVANLTVQSTDGASVTTINVQGSGLYNGVEVLANLGDVTFEGFTVENFTQDGIKQSYSQKAGTRFHVINNVVTPQADYLRNGIEVTGDGSTVVGNTINGMQLTPDWASCGIQVDDASNVEVLNNKVIGDISNGVDFGICVAAWDYDIDNVLIQGNEISKANSAAINVSAIFASHTISNIEILNNTISNSGSGVGFYGVDPGILTLDGVFKIEGNSVDPTGADLDVGSKVIKGATLVFDASPNWWGSAYGPEIVSASTSVTLDDIEYSPWCADAACTTTISAPTLSIVPVGGETQCGPTTNTVVDIMINDLNELTPLQSYTVTMGFDPAQVSIAEADIVNGGLLPDGGTFLITQDNVTGKIEVVYTVLGGTSGSGTGSLVRITLTHVGDPDSIILTLDQEKSKLSGPDGYFLPIGSVSGATITRQDVVVQNTTTGVGYCDLATAINAATAEDTLQLLADITIPETVTVDKALTLDLNGKVVTYSTAENSLDDGPFALKVDGTTATLTVIDGSTSGTGKLLLVDSNLTDTIVAGMGIKVSTGGTLIFNSGTIESPYSSVYLMEDGKMTLNGGTLTSFHGIIVRKAGATLTVEGGTINAQGGFAIGGNGTAGGTTITVNDGNLSSTAVAAIFHPQDGVLTINGGTIQGYNGIEMKAGDLIVTGGTISATGAKVDPEYTNTSGSTNTGDAIFVYNHAGYTGDLTVDISGGEISATVGYALRQYLPVTDPVTPLRTTSLAVDGGKFTGGAGAVQFTTVEAAILKLTGGAYNTDPAVYVFVPYHTSEDADEYFRIYSLLPVITSDDIQGYYLVDEEREFHVSMTNPIGAAAYEAVMFKVTITGATKTDITSAQFYETGWAPESQGSVPDWFDMYFTETEEGDLVAWYGGIFYGGFGLPADDVTHTEKLRVNFAVPGDYPITLELYTVTGNDLGEPYDYSDEAGQLITTESFVMNTYTRPVITSDLDLLGPVPTNTATSVTFYISNPDKLTGTFDLLLDLPVNTIVEYNGQTYTCGISGCLIPVDMDSASEELVMTMTFPYPFSGPVYGALLDPAYTPDRELALFTSESNLIVVDANGIHAVTGNILMQGRYGAGGVKVLLSSPVFHPHVYDASSANGGDYDLGLVVGTELTFTTDQPRYLNVTADLNKTFTLRKAETLNALVLRGGNAQESGNENVIDTRDLGLVGSAYGGTTTSETPGDVNFDLVVDIRDLSLVGGNWGLTSYQAYSEWEPLGE